MKRLFLISLLLPLVLIGCKKGAQDAEPETIKLSVEPSSITCPAFGADYTISLTAPEAWTASCADSWVRVSPTSGNAGTVEINVKISANKESKESTSKIVFKSGDKVRVTHGPFYGVEGYIRRDEGGTSVILNVDILGQAVAVSISPSDCEKIG